MEMVTEWSCLHRRRIYILGGVLKYIAPSAMDITAIPVYVQKSAFTAVSLEHKQKRLLHQRNASLLPKFLHQRESTTVHMCVGSLFFSRDFSKINRPEILQERVSGFAATGKYSDLKIPL